MKTNIQDLLDFKIIDPLLKSYNNTSGFKSYIIDKDGNLISNKDVRFICSEFHQKIPNFTSKCSEQLMELSSNAKKNKVYSLNKSLEGWIEIIIPIFIREKHVANFITGQFFYKKPDESFYIQFAEKNKFEKAKYLDALHQVPIINEEKAQSSFDFLITLIQLIGNMAEQKLEQIEYYGELKMSEEKYKALYENVPLSYQSLNEDGTFKDVNSTWLSLLGYKRDEVIGKRYIDFLHPDWQDHFKLNFPAFKARGYVHDVQFKIRHKDGQFLDISFEGCIGHHPDGSFKQTYCVFKDITREKDIEHQLFESNVLNQSIIRSAQEGIIVYGSDLKYKVWNPYMENISGILAKDVLGKHPKDLFPHLVEYGLIDDMEAMLKSGEPKSKELPFNVGKHSGWFSDVMAPLLNLHGEIIGIIATVKDITERKKNQETLKKSEEILRKHKENLEELVANRTMELEEKFAEVDKMNKLFVGRELKMIELKNELKGLHEKTKNTD